MGTSKILFDGVGIDLTSDTVTSGTILSGYKAHDSNGDNITGNISTYSVSSLPNADVAVNSNISIGIKGSSVILETANYFLDKNININISDSIKRDSSDITRDQNVVTVNSGYYSNNSQLTIPLYSGTQASGNINITSNGSYNVIEKATATVNIPGNPNSRHFVINIPADISEKKEASLIMTVTDPEILAHRTDASMSIYFEALFDITEEGVVCSLTRNRNVGTKDNTLVLRMLNGERGIVSTAWGVYRTYVDQNGHVILKSDGGVYTGGSANVPVKAGNYSITFQW